MSDPLNHPGDLEALEERRLLAIPHTFTPNIYTDDKAQLHIEGGRKADKIIVSLDRGNPMQLAININKVVTIISVEDYRGGIIEGNRGNDRIVLDDTYGQIPRLHQVAGGDGDDTLLGSTTADSMVGGAGNDLIYGGLDEDSLEGGDGDDTIYGENGNDTITGLVGNDVLSGGKGNDNLDGGDDNDVVYGDDGNDSILGGVGDDTLWGNNGNDTISGEDGEDVMFDGPGRDLLQL